MIFTICLLKQSLNYLLVKIYLKVLFKYVIKPA